MNNKPTKHFIHSSLENAQLIDELNDEKLLATAVDRISHLDSSRISFDEVKRELDITDEDLANFDDVELE